MTMHVDPAVWQAFFDESPDPCFAYSVDGLETFTLAAEELTFSRFSGSGLAGFVQKPFTADLLSEKLGQALRLT